MTKKNHIGRKTMLLAAAALCAAAALGILLQFIRTYHLLSSSGPARNAVLGGLYCGVILTVAAAVSAALLWRAWYFCGKDRPRREGQAAGWQTKGELLAIAVAWTVAAAAGLLSAALSWESLTGETRVWGVLAAGIMAAALAVHWGRYLACLKRDGGAGR